METAQAKYQTVVEISDGRKIKIQSWAIMPTRDHILALAEMAKGAVVSGLIREETLASMDLGKFIESLDLKLLLSDANFQALVKMVSDATELTEAGQRFLSPEAVSQLNQYDFEALARAVWEINIRPRMALLKASKKLTGPSTNSALN